MKKIINVLVGLSALILIWQLGVTLGNYNPALFPSPLDVLKGLQELIADNTLQRGIIDSMYRFSVGYGIAIFFGILLGLLLGWFQGIWRFVNPVVQVLRPISPIAWLPFVVLWYGIGDKPAIIIVIIAAFFPVLLTTVTAVSRVDQTHLKVAKNFGMNQFQTLVKIVFPAAFPHIATGLHLALGTAWIFIVAGEMVGAQSGLGFLIIDARNNLRADLLMAAMLAIGILGLLLDGCIRIFEKWVFAKWGFRTNERSV